MIEIKKSNKIDHVGFIKNWVWLALCRQDTHILFVPTEKDTYNGTNVHIQSIFDN